MKVTTPVLLRPNFEEDKFTRLLGRLPHRFCCGLILKRTTLLYLKPTTLGRLPHRFCCGLILERKIFVNNFSTSLVFYWIISLRDSLKPKRTALILFNCPIVNFCRGIVIRNYELELEEKGFPATTKSSILWVFEGSRVTKSVPYLKSGSVVLFHTL